MASRAAIETVVGQYFKAIRAGNIDAIVATFAADAVSHDPVGAPPHEGHEGIRRFFEDVGTRFETLHLHEDHTFIAGNGAAVKWTAHGVGKNGHEVTFEGIDVFEVNDDGQIQQLWAYWNPAPVMTELNSQ